MLGDYGPRRDVFEMHTEHKLRQAPKPDHAGSEIIVPRDCLRSALDLSINEIAVMWILHQSIAARHPLRELIQDIVDFYPVALNAILQADVMRGARQADLRLIYFKGLMVARTHPRLEIINAIRRADSALENAIPREQSRAIGRLSADSLTEDSDTLAHIAVALGHSARSSH